MRDDDTPDEGGVAAKRMGTHRVDHALRLRLGDDGHELAFIRDVKGIEAEHFAGAAHLATNRKGRLFERDAHTGCRR
jgi:hypothetical protein